MTVGEHATGVPPRYAGTAIIARLLRVHEVSGALISDKPSRRSLLISPSVGNNEQTSSKRRDRRCPCHLELDSRRCDFQTRLLDNGDEWLRSPEDSGDARRERFIRGQYVSSCLQREKHRSRVAAAFGVAHGACNSVKLARIFH